MNGVMRPMTLDGLSVDEWQEHFERNGESPAIPAATVVVLRNGADGVETLMLRRNSKIAFGGMWVFPGGRIDETDHANSTGDGVAAAARQAAVREAHEEASIELDAASLVAFSFWLPPPILPKRFATWFFAAPAPTSEVTVDQGEIVHHEWMTPTEAMQRQSQGQIELAPPTWVTLHTLQALEPESRRGSHNPNATGNGAAGQVMAGLTQRGFRRYETRMGKTEQGPVSMWIGDAGYETGDATKPGPRHRLEMYKEGFNFDESGYQGSYQ